MAKLKRFVPLPWPPPDPATEVEFKAVKDIHILGTLRGVVAIAGRQTQNRRTYSREVLYKMVEQFNALGERGMLGRIFPNTFDVEQDIVTNCGVITTGLSMDKDGECLIAEMKVLQTPAGRVLTELLRNDTHVYMASAGFGNIKDGVVDAEDYKLDRFDIVLNPVYTKPE